MSLSALKQSTVNLRVAPASRRSVKVLAAKKATKAEPPAGPSYVCLDCGYVYPGSLAAFEKLKDSYKCPVCKAPKSRFALVKPGEEDALGPILIPGAATLAFLGAIYYFLHSSGKM